MSWDERIHDYRHAYVRYVTFCHATSICLKWLFKIIEGEKCRSFLQHVCVKQFNYTKIPYNSNIKICFSLCTSFEYVLFNYSADVLESDFAPIRRSWMCIVTSFVIPFLRLVSHKCTVTHWKLPTWHSTISGLMNIVYRLYFFLL